MATVTVTMDGKHYGTHAEVLNRFFGKDFSVFRGAECKEIGSPGYSVWFPVVSQTSSRNSAAVKMADNGWINLLVNDGKEIQQYWPAQAMASQQLRASEKRITFAKFIKGGKYWYEFIGVFAKDTSQSAMDHTVYKRIATQYP